MKNVLDTPIPPHHVFLPEVGCSRYRVRRFCFRLCQLTTKSYSWTIFWGELLANKIGKGRNAYVPAEDNIEQDNGSEWVLRDRT